MEGWGFRLVRGKSVAEQFGAAVDTTPIPDSVLVLLKRTRNLYRLWWVTHYTIGLSGVVAGALLTALTAGSGSGSGMSQSLEYLREYAWLIGIIAAVATSLVTFLGPLHKAERYWSAYHLLEQACLEYIGDDADPKLKRLMKRVMNVRRILQVADGDEKIVGDVKDNLGGTAGKPA
ncbi:MAG TPA: hypothetical protein VF620_04310 [Allosphingosinicella sp.]|jgi:hypothetical protein